MPYCKKSLNILLVITLWLFSGAVFADGIDVKKAEIHLSEDGYQLSADFNVQLNSVVQQAVSLGVPLYFVGEFSLTRSSWYWLDEKVFQSENTVKLSYNVLTRQYRISRGALFQNFSTLEDLMRILARQNSDYIPVELIKGHDNLIASIRLRLDTKQLPKLMQVNVLTSKDWDFDSGWYRWVILPSQVRNAEKIEER
jgi:hypothetical protein